MKYSFHPYHDYYKTRAYEEIAQLKQLYPYSTVEHFGSTAVPGLGGKDIIDIAILVPGNKFETTFRQINSTAYDFRPTGGIPGERYFFQKTIKYPNGRKQLFHLHLTKLRNENMLECFAFRDYLRSHSSLAHEYSIVKHKAVEAAKKLHKKAAKKKIYRDIKWPTMQKILTLIDGKQHSA